jgi:hypothetical protein
MTLDFYLGCFMGFVFASFIGFVLNQIRLEQKNIGAHRKPQVVLAQSPKTPADVVNSHRSAVARIVGWTMLLVAVSAGFFFALTLF